MNLVLAGEDERIAPGRVRLSGRKAAHLREVLKLAPGDDCKMGMLDGMIGKGVVREMSETGVVLDFFPEKTPPPPLRLKLCAALQRPNTFRKILYVASSFGVKELHFFHCFKVEKSYWQSPVLQEEKYRQDILLALEQAGDTGMVRVFFHRSFKTFAGETLPGIAAGGKLFVLHPGAGGRKDFGGADDLPATVLLGPEGGFTPDEAATLLQCGERSGNGAEYLDLGERILRSEFALAKALSLFSR